MTGRMFTARAVAELLGVSPATVLRWTRHGDLPALRLPSGAIRIREDQLEQWLEERATPRREAPTNPTGAARSSLSSVVPTNPHDERT